MNNKVKSYWRSVNSSFKELISLRISGMCVQGFLKYRRKVLWKKMNEFYESRREGVRTFSWTP